MAKAASLAKHNSHSLHSHSPQGSHDSPPTSPQPMQIDCDPIEDEENPHHQHLHNHMDLTEDLTAEEHNQANASALAVAAAAAQAHLNGTSEYISKTKKL